MLNGRLLRTHFNAINPTKSCYYASEFSWLLPLLLISLLPSVFWVISSWIGGYQSVHGSGVSYPIFPSFSSSPRPLSIPRRLHDFLRLRAWALRCSWCSVCHESLPLSFLRCRLQLYDIRIRIFCVLFMGDPNWSSILCYTSNNCSVLPISSHRHENISSSRLFSGTIQVDLLLQFARLRVLKELGSPMIS